MTPGQRNGPAGNGTESNTQQTAGQAPTIVHPESDNPRDAAYWANLIRGSVDLGDPSTCACGSPVEVGKGSCRECLAAEARIRWCGRCGEPTGGGLFLCAACAHRGARVLRDAVEAGSIQVADLLPKPRRGGSAQRELQKLHGTAPEPNRPPSKAQRRAERDRQEADARALMRAQGVPLGAEVDAP
jgi:hypothetical protein